MSLRNAKLLNPDKVPAGWFTVEEIAKSEDPPMSTSHAAKLLREAAAAGTWERKAYRIVRGGRLLPVAHFREKPTRSRKKDEPA